MGIPRCLHLVLLQLNTGRALGYPLEVRATAFESSAVCVFVCVYIYKIYHKTLVQGGPSGFIKSGTL